MVKLVPLEWDHWKMYRKWVNDPEIALLIDRYLPVSKFQHRKFYESLLLDKTKIFFSVLKGPKDRFVGVCALKNIHPKSRKAEFYICLNGKGVRGKGLGRQVVQKILDYAFDTLNLNRVYLFTPVYNKAAIRCYRSVGFVEEGRFLEDVYANGCYHDSIHMCYLRRFRKGTKTKGRRV